MAEVPKEKSHDETEAERHLEKHKQTLQSIVLDKKQTVQTIDIGRFDHYR